MSEHLLSHSATENLYTSLISKGHQWESLKSDCEEIYKSCTACQLNTIVKRGFHPQQSHSSSNPMDSVAIDLIGPLETTREGYKYILVVVDIFSRFTWLSSLKSKAAQEVAQNLFTIFINFGHPKVLISDNGTEFINETIEHLQLLFTWEHRRSSPYYPQSNGIAERTVAETKSLLRKRIAAKENEWNTLLPSVQCGLNARIHSLTNSSPFSIMFTRSLNEFKTYNGIYIITPSAEQIEKRISLANEVVFPAILKKATDKINQRNNLWNKKHNLTNKLLNGSVVMIKLSRTTSLQFPYVGPYRVLRQTNSGNYILQDGNNNTLKTSFPISRLKQVTSDILTSNYYVETILSHKFEQDGTALFKIRWLGYPESFDTWEPVSNFDDKSVVTNYINFQKSAGNWEGSDVIH